MTLYQPIETAPKDGRTVIIYSEPEHGDDPLIIGAKWVPDESWHDGGYWSAPGGEFVFDPTKWAPAPTDAPMPTWAPLLEKVEAAVKAALPEGANWLVEAEFSEFDPDEAMVFIVRTGVVRVGRLHYLAVLPKYVESSSPKELTQWIRDAYERDVEGAA